jgi:hypothetical protein
MIIEFEDNKKMENHLGKNPVSGGNPPNDKNSNGKIID